MYASPVVDTAKLENLDHADWLEETNMDELRYFSIRHDTEGYRGTLGGRDRAAGTVRPRIWQTRKNTDGCRT